jgi:deoxyribodipyrimidine photo-lyase
LKEVNLEALYIFSLAELKTANTGPVRVDFIRRNLACLQKDLAEIGITLTVLLVDEKQSYAQALSEFCHEHRLGTVFFNKEFDPVALARDENVKKGLTAEHIGYQSFFDQCIVQEGFILTKMGKPYGMFTPFKRTWIQHIKEHPIKLLESPREFKERAVECREIPAVPGYALTDDAELRQEAVLEQFCAGEEAALAKLETFLAERGRTYHENRDFPSISGTSKISPYLSVGAISARTAFELSRKANNGLVGSGSEGLQKFISELCWRDFFRHIMHHFPQISEGMPFKPEAADIEWREGPDAEKDFELWCAGRTGVPIVDAAMRQMAQTGWMHNRLRMVVSMFLTKDLLIYWKKGESWFSSHLIDYDFPSNNGGWQWSSSTGTDSSPWFNIFNPFLQSERFDKDGTFIKHYLPELIKVPAKAIHNPNEHLSKSEKASLCPNYPDLISDQKTARKKALAVFKKAFKKLQ